MQMHTEAFEVVSLESGDSQLLGLLINVSERRVCVIRLSSQERQPG